MKKFVVGLALIGLLAGCSSASTPSNTTNSNTSKPTSEKIAKPEVKNASDLVSQLKQSGLPIGDQDVYTADKDPNHLLGRPGQYTSKVNFKDNNVKEPGNSIEVVNGGSVEMFNNADDAKNRFEYVSKIAKSAPMFNEYDYVNGKIVLRISKDLTPDQATKYEDAFKKIGQ